MSVGRCRRQEVIREGIVEGAAVNGQEVAVCCAHRESVRYPLADIDVRVSGRRFTVWASVLDKLPVLVLFGCDVPGLLRLLAAKTNSEFSRVGSSDD